MQAKCGHIPPFVLLRNPHPPSVKHTLSLFIMIAYAKTTKGLPQRCVISAFMNTVFSLEHIIPTVIHTTLAISLKTAKSFSTHHLLHAAETHPDRIYCNYCNPCAAPFITAPFYYQGTFL